ncbi:MarR family winged helix-turn-helix transcriptional regulator [Subtercola boreus]|uniref:MarR family winged helix-turn-helix transcriptional regulator n=1 Tax=Subtercola boreus TaxID=120213 RepID=UPI00147547ED|nr:MarR family transcriptional regulator [Subtercola boreus]
MRQFLTALHQLDTEHRHLKSSFARHLGLAQTDYYALMFIADAQTVTPKQLAASLNFTTGATTAMIDRIEKLGLVHRIPNPDDRRSLHLELTAAGIEASSWVTDRYLETARAALTLEHSSTPEHKIDVLTHATEAMTATVASLRGDDTPGD